jgi:hypothetical protein
MWSNDFIMAISANSFSCSFLHKPAFFIFLAARNNPVNLERTLFTLPNPPLPIYLIIA